MIEFVYVFNKKNIEQVLNEALNNDVKQVERQKMATALYETDGLQSCSSLVRLLESEVTATVNASHQFTLEQY